MLLLGLRAASNSRYSYLCRNLALHKKALHLKCSGQRVKQTEGRDSQYQPLSLSSLLDPLAKEHASSERFDVQCFSSNHRQWFHGET